MSGFAIGLRPGGIILLIGILATMTPARAMDFTELSIDELMQVKISSVSRKLESLFDAPAAVHVISNEDVKRSGVTSLSDALRMSPGMHVARLDGYNTAVAARGFNDISSNKLLVMTDGRTIYSPLFSGVQWGDQQIVMEDLDRIEVIRGPGASLWGANAVNGVINITTKSARDTLGSFSSVLFGNYLERQFVARHGMDLGGDRYLRFYTKYRKQGPAISDSSETPMVDLLDPDGYDQGMVGFRYDWEGESRGKLTFQGDIYGATGELISENLSLLPPYKTTDIGKQDHHGTYLLGRWTRSAWDDGEYSIQGYLDYYSQDNHLFALDQFVADVDTQLRRRLNEHNEIVTGGGIRFYRDDLSDDRTYTFNPPGESRWLFSAFVQDEFQAIPDKLSLTIGAKIEHTEYTGFEFQPNIRALYHLADNQTVWASAAQAARTPSRAERSARITVDVYPPNPVFPAPTEIIWQTNGDFESENLAALEIGHRISFGEPVSLDSALFYNQYTDLRSISLGTPYLEPTPFPHAVVPSYVNNALDASTYGAEFTLNWLPAKTVRLQGTVSLFRYDLEPGEETVPGLSESSVGGNTPETQIGLRAMVDVSKDWLLDITTHYMSELISAEIDAYAALDIRLSWSPRPGLDFAIVGRDLLEAEHEEFPPTFIGGGIKRIPRSYYTRVNWSF